MRNGNKLTCWEIIIKMFMLYTCLCQTYIIECLPNIEEKSNQVACREIDMRQKTQSLPTSLVQNLYIAPLGKILSINYTTLRK